MTPAELISADDHLATCEICYLRIGRLDHEDDEVVLLPVELPSSADSDIGHLTYERLANYVEDKLDEMDREIADVHLEVCSDCADDLRNLEAFRHAMMTSELRETQTGSPSFWERVVKALGGERQWRLSPVAWTAALLTVALLGMILWFTLRSPGAPPQIAKENIPGTSESPQKENGNINPTPSVPPTLPNVTPDVALNDGAGQVGLDREGNLAGLENLPQTHKRAVQNALASGRVDVPASLAGLKGKAGILMAGSSEGVPFALISPVGVVVSNDRPSLRWQPLTGASSYLVNVYDSKFNRLETSPSLTTTSWTLTRPLSRGAVYLWQVTAIKDGTEIKSPVSPAPEAHFKVLDRSWDEQLRRARREHGNSHLLLGTLFAQAGLLADAEREFGALVAANPKSPVAQKLMHSVRALR